MSSEEAVAFRMFMRRCECDDLEPALAELAWNTEPSVRDFWLAEASFAIGVYQEELNKLYEERLETARRANVA